MIVIEPYQASWADEFIEIESTLQQAMGGLALRIDHIGSTSVPGLCAKDVIDVQVAVEGLSDEVREVIVDLGFQHLPHITGDHIPLNSAYQSPDDWQKLFFRGPKGKRRINCHVRLRGKANHRYAILFRDYLRTFPEVAAVYGKIKKTVAQNHKDEDTYYKIKDPVTDLILAAADQWAERIGWHLMMET